MSKLDEIFEYKRAEVAANKQQRTLAAVAAAVESAPPPLDFRAALRGAPRPALIAEVKAASPSRGQLAGRNGRPFDPVALARTYAGNGAAAISVLTDAKHFGGSLEHLRAIRAALPRTPLLRKDFVFDPYQVYEARAAGADATLLIVAALDAQLLTKLAQLASQLGMAALIEVHNARELDQALSSGAVCDASLIGINNRDLHDFSVRLGTTVDLAPRVPAECLVVAESGIFGAADVARLGQGRGVDAILVGEALVTAPDVAARVRELAGRTPDSVRREVNLESPGVSSEGQT
jgi:indole-3-glycerol phosphate synthase